MCWFVHTYWFVHVSNHVFPPGHHRPNIWKTQPLDLDQGLTPVAGLIFKTKNRAIFLERIFGRGITAREQVSRAVILEKF